MFPNISSLSVPEREEIKETLQLCAATYEFTVFALMGSVGRYFSQAGQEKAAWLDVSRMCPRLARGGSPLVKEKAAVPFLGNCFGAVSLRSF